MRVYGNSRDAFRVMESCFFSMRPSRPADCYSRCFVSGVLLLFNDVDCFFRLVEKVFFPGEFLKAVEIGIEFH